MARLAPADFSLSHTGPTDAYEPFDGPLPRLRTFHHLAAPDRLKLNDTQAFHGP